MFEILELHHKGHDLYEICELLDKEPAYVADIIATYG